MFVVCVICVLRGKGGASCSEYISICHFDAIIIKWLWIYINTRQHIKAIGIDEILIRWTDGIG